MPVSNIFKLPWLVDQCLTVWHTECKFFISFRIYARAEGLQRMLTVRAFWQIVAHCRYIMEVAQKDPRIGHGILDLQMLGGLCVQKHDFNFVQVI